LAIITAHLGQPSGRIFSNYGSTHYYEITYTDGLIICASSRYQRNSQKKRIVKRRGRREERRHEKKGERWWKRWGERMEAKKSKKREERIATKSKKYPHLMTSAKPIPTRRTHQIFHALAMVV
jgi:hypothetical protein